MIARSIGKQSAQPNAGTNTGLQHACGHECHDVMTLVATKHLARTGCFDRTLTLISQCAEKDLGGANKWRATASSADFHTMSFLRNSNNVCIDKDCIDGHVPCMAHDSNYDFDDSSIAVASTFWQRLAHA